MRTDGTKHLELKSAFTSYVPIIWQMSATSLKVEAYRTFGGILWWIGEPVIYSVIYYFVFAVVFQSRTEDFIAFLLVGLITWRWMQMSITAASSSVSTGASLMRQVHVPKIIFPLQRISEQGIKFLIAAPIIMVAIAAMGAADFSRLYLLPIVLLSAVAFVIGTGVLLSALVPFIPDIQRVLAFVFRGLFFLSGIFFDSSRIPEEYLTYYYLNPFAVIIESMRNVVMLGKPLETSHLLWVTALSLLFMVAGCWLHMKYNRVYPKFL